ncbi:MAG: adenylate kinase, partial [Desulfosarcina sp.]|nr:adenylate kinase [Desulfobacterales bacterium]
IDAIKPDGDKCRVCGGDLTKRDDDQDEEAINKRHNIYYDTDEGTLAASYYFKDLSEKKGSEKDGSVKYVTLDGAPSVQDVTAELVSKL